jgi:hypothetical protein
VIARNVNKVASGVVKILKIPKDKNEIKVAKINPFTLDISPVAIGRFAVRFISRSDLASITILNALAPPAANVPPTNAQIVTDNSGTPSLAKNKAGSVVTSRSSTTRNFISEM